eukprot:GGOE01036716.1.p1 GENE.GGOE01036716.1~~GGOE01036716.1.p1  ORF type:complete len:279 (+),score=50.84 GGOE01036716.1:37-873(+)
MYLADKLQLTLPNGHISARCPALPEVIAITTVGLVVTSLLAVSATHLHRTPHRSPTQHAFGGSRALPRDTPLQPGGSIQPIGTSLAAARPPVALPASTMKDVHPATLFQKAAILLSAVLGSVLGVVLWRKLPPASPLETIALAAAVSSSQPSISVAPGDTSLCSSLCQVTDTNFTTEVLQSPLPVLVCFSEPSWCEPCKRMEPVIRSVAREHCGQLVVVKVDPMEAPVRTAEFGVRIIPTLVLVKDGAKKETIIGFVSKSFIVGTISPHLPQHSALGS